MVTVWSWESLTRQRAVHFLKAGVCLVFADWPLNLGVGSNLWIVHLDFQQEQIQKKVRKKYIYFPTSKDLFAFTIDTLTGLCFELKYYLFERKACIRIIFVKEKGATEKSIYP